MPPVLTITPNPAVDIAASIDRMRAGPKLRLRNPRTDPGGGGINVARVIARLGGKAVALAAVGGPQGQQLAALLEAAGVPFRPFAIAGNTRLALTVAETETGAEFRLLLPGAAWDEARTGEFVAAAVDAARDCGTGFAVLSGSLPEGMTPALPRQLADALAEAGAGLIVDTSGEALTTLMQPGDQPVAMLRMNRAEAEEATGRSLPDPAAAADCAAALVAGGTALRVVIGLGAAGSVLADGRQRLICPPPQVPVASRVGAGDSFLGAFVLELARNSGAAQALEAGVAAAAAAVTTLGTELCPAETFRRLRPHCRAHPI